MAVRRRRPITSRAETTKKPAWRVEKSPPAARRSRYDEASAVTLDRTGARRGHAGDPIRVGVDVGDDAIDVAERRFDPGAHVDLDALGGGGGGDPDAKRRAGSEDRSLGAGEGVRGSPDPVES